MSSVERAMAGHAPAGGCRFCEAPLTQVFADLGVSPIANNYLADAQLATMEPFYPLRALVCDRCWLVQLEDYESPEAIFADDYAYYSSYSQSWLAHCRAYTELVVDRFGLGDGHTVVEIASNDGYLLQYFAQRGIRVLGIEPAKGVAEAAAVKGVPTITRFMGTELADELAPTSQADLLIGNNVLAHVPDINDFVAAMTRLLKPDGVITMEFPHLMRLVEESQFDTIYHEHFSYLSASTAARIFDRHGLELFDVEELPTHGGSLRIYARHTGSGSEPPDPRVAELLRREHDAGYDESGIYAAFAEKVRQLKREVLTTLVEAKEAGATIVGYGAPAKGNTLLNYCGVGRDFIDFTVDLNPHKQGHYLPGTRIPILAPEEIRRARPDYVLILPWNLKDEIMDQLGYIREWGGKFIVRTPDLQVLP